MILAYSPSLLLSLAVLPAYHLRVFDTAFWRTQSKAHLFYVAAIHLFGANSRSLVERMLAKHFHVAISWTKSLVSNLFYVLDGEVQPIEKRNISGEFRRSGAL